MTDDKPDELPVSRIDCETCYGEGWYWNGLLKEERPCIDCEGLGSLPIKGNQHDR